MTKKKTPEEKAQTKMGRPLALEQPETRALLLAAASFDMNTTAMCAYAKIDTATYYRYIKDNPDFLNEIEQKRTTPYQLALQTIIGQLDKDPHLAIKYLERKHRNEFSLRREMTGADGENLMTGLAGLIAGADKVLEEHGESS